MNHPSSHDDLPVAAGTSSALASGRPSGKEPNYGPGLLPTPMPILTGTGIPTLARFSSLPRLLPGSSGPNSEVAQFYSFNTWQPTVQQSSFVHPSPYGQHVIPGPYSYAAAQHPGAAGLVRQHSSLGFQWPQTEASIYGFLPAGPSPNLYGSSLGIGGVHGHGHGLATSATWPRGLLAGSTPLPTGDLGQPYAPMGRPDSPYVHNNTTAAYESWSLPSHAAFPAGSVLGINPRVPPILANPRPECTPAVKDNDPTVGSSTVPLRASSGAPESSLAGPHTSRLWPHGQPVRYPEPTAVSSSSSVRLPVSTVADAASWPRPHGIRQDTLGQSNVERTSAGSPSLPSGPPVDSVTRGRHIGQGRGGSNRRQQRDPKSFTTRPLTRPLPVKHTDNSGDNPDEPEFLPGQRLSSSFLTQLSRDCSTPVSRSKGALFHGIARGSQGLRRGSHPLPGPLAQPCASPEAGGLRPGHQQTDAQRHRSEIRRSDDTTDAPDGTFPHPERPSRRRRPSGSSQAREQSGPSGSKATSSTDRDRVHDIKSGVYADVSINASSALSSSPRRPMQVLPPTVPDRSGTPVEAHVSRDTGGATATLKTVPLINTGHEHSKLRAAVAVSSTDAITEALAQVTQQSDRLERSPSPPPLPPRIPHFFSATANIPEHSSVSVTQPSEIMTTSGHSSARSPPSPALSTVTVLSRPSEAPATESETPLTPRFSPMAAAATDSRSPGWVGTKRKALRLPRQLYLPPRLRNRPPIAEQAHTALDPSTASSPPALMALSVTPSPPPSTSPSFRPKKSELVKRK